VHFDSLVLADGLSDVFPLVSYGICWNQTGCTEAKWGFKPHNARGLTPLAISTRKCDHSFFLLARDVIYRPTSRAYAIRCKCPSVRLSVTEVHWRIMANLGFIFRSLFTAHCGRGACGREGRDHRRKEWRDHLALC